MADPMSVVIPAFDAATTIEATIRSVLAQSRTDFELVVVDDGSTDDTADRVAALARDDDRISLLRRPNRGVAEARNAGIEATHGEYVSFLDSDDLWLPEYLAAMSAALDKRPRAGLAFTDAWILDDRTGRIHRRSMMESRHPPHAAVDDPDELLRLLLNGNFVFTSATVRREALSRCGGFRSTQSPAEDYDLWLRIAARGYGGARAPGRLAVYRDRSGSLSSSLTTLYAAERRVYEGIIGEEGIPPDARELAISRARDCERRLALVAELSPPGRVRRTLSRAKWSLMWRRTYYGTPPDELLRAFPDLADSER